MANLKDAANLKNITNGVVELDVDREDLVPQNFKFLRVPGGDMLDTLRRKDPSSASNFYIENIRTGSFSQISQKYSIESKSQKQTQTTYITDTFQTEMTMLRSSVQTKLSKAISFFQGIFAGMALLFTITLNLSETVSQNLVRVQDQCIRVVALLTTLGSFFSLFRARDRYQWMKLRGNSKQIDDRYKTLVLSAMQMLFYTLSYIIYNVSHTFSVSFNISGTNYLQLSTLTTVYTVLCLLGWMVTNVNTKKHEK